MSYQYKHKIIFLSVEGVLNSDKHFAKNPQANFDLRAMKRLNKIIEETRACVVVCCGMRINNAIWDLQQLFNKAGFVGSVLSRTHVLFDTHVDIHFCKGNEIAHWIGINKSKVGKAKDFNSYVILAHDIGVLYAQADHLVQTDQKLGLTTKNVNLAIKILNQ